MGIFSGFFEQRLTPSRPGLAALGNFGVASAAGPTVGEASALGYPALYACVKVIAEDVAQLPLKFFERASDGGKREKRDDPRWAMLHDEANPEMTAYELRLMMAWQVATWGNAYAEIEWDDAGYPVALWPLLPDPMSTELVRWDGELYYLVRVPGESGRRALPGYRVLHLRNLLGSSGLHGRSVLRLHMESIGFGLALQEFGATYFGNGARPGGVLEHPGKLSKEAQTRLTESFNLDHGGLSNAHRLKVLEEGMKYSPISVPPEEAQFLQSRVFQLGEMARIYRIQPHMVGDLSRSTNNNIEQQSLEHVIYTLQPWLIGFEQGYRRALLLPKEKKSLSFEHAVNGLLRGDFSTRYAGYALGRQWGWLSVNDVLKLENMNPVPGGDARLSPLNMAELGKTQPADNKRGGLPRTERRADEDTAADRRRLTGTQRPLIEDAAGRVVRREVADIRRSVQKYLVKANDLQGFRLWLVDFYDEHRGFIDRQMTPTFEAIGRLVLDAIARELGEDGLDQHDAAMLEESRAFVQSLALSWALGNRNELDSLTRDGETSEIADALNTRLDGWEETEAGKIGMRESVRAIGALSLAAYGLAGVLLLRWMSSGSENCPYCESLHGRVVGIREAFVPAGDWKPEGAAAPMKIRSSAFHPPVHDGCLTGDSRVLPGGGVAATSERRFDGDVIVIHTASGHRLTCTPNHPILTPGGWVAAGLLNEGGHVISDGRSEWGGSGDGDNENMPIRIQEIVKTFGDDGTMRTIPMPVTAEHFHGDGVGSKIAIVRTNGLLLDGFDSPVCEHCGQGAFVVGDVDSVRLASLGGEAAFGKGFLASGSSSVSRSSLGQTLVGSPLGGAHQLGFAVAAGGNAILEEVAADHAAGHAELERKGIFGLPAQIFADEIVSVERNAFHGFVYNLQTELGWYVAEGIITHNCDCVIMAG